MNIIIIVIIAIIYNHHFLFKHIHPRKIVSHRGGGEYNSQTYRFVSHPFPHPISMGISGKFIWNLNFKTRKPPRYLFTKILIPKKGKTSGCANRRTDAEIPSDGELTGDFSLSTPVFPNKYRGTLVLCFFRPSLPTLTVWIDCVN